MKRVLTFLILSTLFLSACNTQEPDGAVTPESAETTATVAAATPEPVEEPAASNAEAVTGDSASLTVHPWQWISFTSPAEQVDVAAPDRYRILFNEDGTLQIVADCNNATGDYTDDTGALTIVIGPATLADCLPESLTDPFITYLQSAGRYVIEEGNLHIDLAADGGTMVFAPSDNSNMVATGEGDVAAPMFMDGDLVATPWQWISFSSPAEQFDVETPEAYLLQFNEDNTVNVVADCNDASGSFTLTTGFSIEIGPVTMAACPPESRSLQFLTTLSSAAVYFFEDGNLHIDLMADGGTMTFAPADRALLAKDEQNALIAELPEPIVAQLDAFLQSQVYSEGGDPRGAAPGLVLLVETPDGRYLNAAGVANLEDGTPMQVDDILQIGSNTKSMTIVLLMQLVEEGVISLDDLLSQYLPDQAALLPNGDQITIRQMAQHTAGLYDYADTIMAAGVEDPTALEAGFTPDELVQAAVEYGTPYFAPGEEGAWYYSNTGYILLGMIIESLAGETYGDLIQARIFDPLGMESAVFLEGVPQEGQITTHGYWWQGDEIVDTTNWNASQGWAAGAAAMTAEDLATYGKALASGELFQNAETLNEMLTFDPNALQILGTPYGLGLFDVAGDGSVWGHAGQTLGFQSVWFTDPEQGIMFVGLTNSATYKAEALLNVRNIIDGNGPLPVGLTTLLPIASPTTWRWTQFITPAAATEIDETATSNLLLSADQGILVFNPICGAAVGSYTVDGQGQINFDLDSSNLTCDADSVGGQFVQYLNDAVSWRFDNGTLVIDLPADGGTLILTTP